MTDDPSASGLNQRLAALMAPKSFPVFMLRRMKDDEITLVAASLSYWTTLAVVPALALVLSMLDAFPAFRTLRVTVQEFILGNFLPSTGLKISEQLASFIEKAGGLAAVGVIGLAVTSIMMLLTIEDAFNRIFRARRTRRLYMRLLVLWAVVTIGPFLIGLSFTLSGYFAAADNMFNTTAGLIFSIIVGQLMPTLISWIAITFIYLVVPNRRVPWIDAMMGAAFAAIMFAALRFGFAAFVASMTSYETIYGAVAAVPIFLVWIYAAWMVLMMGAVVAASLREWRFKFAGGRMGGLAMVGFALDVLSKLAMAQSAGGGLTTRALSKAVTLPDLTLLEVLEQLKTGRFVAVTDDGRWLLSRDLDHVALADVVHHFGFGIDLEERITFPGEIGRRLEQYLQRAADSERTVLSVSLSKIVLPPEEKALHEIGAPPAG